MKHVEGRLPVFQIKGTPQFIGPHTDDRGVIVIFFPGAQEYIRPMYKRAVQGLMY